MGEKQQGGREGEMVVRLTKVIGMIAQAPEMQQQNDIGCETGLEEFSSLFKGLGMGYGLWFIAKLYFEKPCLPKAF